MLQIGILVVAVVLIITGIRALVGGEKPGRKQTSKSTAIASLVVGVLLIGFAL